MLCVPALATGTASSTRPIVMGKQREYAPGSLMGGDNAAFVKAYVAMCERGGVTFGEVRIAPTEPHHPLCVTATRPLSHGL